MLRYYGIIKELVDSNTQFYSELFKKLKNSLTSFDINAYLYIITEFKHPKYIFETVFIFRYHFLLSLFDNLHEFTAELQLYTDNSEQIQ